MPTKSATSWILSGPSRGSLLGLGHDLRAYLRDTRDPDVDDVAFTLASDEQRLGHRAVLSGRDPGDFAGALEALELGTPVANLTEGYAEREEGAVFVFPPHGCVGRDGT